ncbi:hypothetical protein CW706_02965 [Candidatus Bathyarchaeota archaeon]|nr:MAG: hypothetical protein CW706_02965 [Candidatus Bathyarchaeota archaeon]
MYASYADEKPPAPCIITVLSSIGLHTTLSLIYSRSIFSFDEACDKLCFGLAHKSKIAIISFIILLLAHILKTTIETVRKRKLRNV